MKNIFSLLETQAAGKKIRSTHVIFKTPFSQGNNSAPKLKIPVQSDPILSPIRSDPESDPESDAGFVSGHDGEK